MGPATTSLVIAGPTATLPYLNGSVMATEVVNPLTEKPLRSEAAEFVTKLREARAGARRAARSGHPAKRAEARRALVDIPGVIRATYMEEANR